MKSVKNKMIGYSAESFDFALERDPDTVYRIPLIQDLPAKDVRALSKAKDSDSADLIFELFDKIAPGLTDVATQRDITLILEAWSDASNAELGE